MGEGMTQESWDDLQARLNRLNACQDCRKQAERDWEAEHLHPRRD